MYWPGVEKNLNCFRRTRSLLPERQWTVSSRQAPVCQLPDDGPTIRVMKPEIKQFPSGEVGECLDHPQGLPRWESDGPPTPRRQPPLSNGNMLFGKPVLPAQQYSRSTYTFRNLSNSKDQTVNDLCPGQRVRFRTPSKGGRTTVQASPLGRCAVYYLSCAYLFQAGAVRPPEAIAARNKTAASNSILRTSTLRLMPRCGANLQITAKMSISNPKSQETKETPR